MTTTDKQRTEAIQMQSAEEIAQKLQAQVARAMIEAAPETRQSLTTFQYEPPPPPPEDVCQTCYGRACVRYSVPIDDPRFGKLFPCPDCEAGHEAMRKRQLRMFAQAQMPKEYQIYRIRHFMPRWMDESGLTDELLEGKRLGIGMAWQFVNNADHGMIEREVYRLWIDVYKANRLPIPAGWEKKAATTNDMARHWLVLHGMNGTGKTALASAIANELIQRGMSVLYIRVDDYLQAAQNTNKPDSEVSEVEVVQAARDAAVLVLDDMNVSKVTDYGRKIMEMVIRHRHNNNMPTIITLNANEQEFEAEWHPRIASVVFGSSHWTPFAGSPLRDERHSLDAF